MNAKPEYVCREPRSPEELLDIFRLRHRVFMQSGLEFLLQSTAAEYEVDIDCYDLRSVHFGLYQGLGADSRLIGSIRAVGRADAPAANWIRTFAVDKPVLLEELDRRPPHAFPLLHYSPFSQAVTAIEKKCAKQEKTLYEISRFVMDPSHRAVFVSHTLIEMMIVYTQCCPGSMIFSCRPEHRPIYQPYFALPLVLTPEFEYGGIKMTIIFWDMALLPGPMRAKMERAVEEYRESGALRFFQGSEIREPHAG